MSSIASDPGARHRLSLERVQTRQAKAELKNLEGRDFRVEIGRAITRARSIVGWTQDQLAGEIAKVLQRARFDPAQVARWEAGKERPQFDVLFAVDALCWPLVQCLAALDTQTEIVTEIRRKVG